MLDGIALGNALIAAYPGRNWLEQCERADWNVMWFALGRPEPEPRGYKTAKLSREASRLTPGLAGAVPGDSLWWKFPPEDHTMIYLGNDAALGATSRGVRLHDFGHGLVIIRASSYPTTLLGHARRHGVWPEFSVAPWQDVQPTPPRPGGALVMPTPDQWRRIQAGLKKRGRYAGPVDGVPGINTWKGVQLSVRSGGGYSGPIDGVPGTHTWIGVQTYAHRWGGYLGPIDGVPGFNTWEGFARGVA